MKLLFIITKGLEKSGSAIRALQIAALTAEQGNHVEVFLIDEAVQWARGIKAANGEGLSDYLEMLKSREHPVLVCKSCAEKRLITQDDLIEGDGHCRDASAGGEVGQPRLQGSYLLEVSP